MTWIVKWRPGIGKPYLRSVYDIDGTTVCYWATRYPTRKAARAVAGMWSNGYARVVRLVPRKHTAASLPQEATCAR
jgi:hypothetical protein